MKTIFKKDIYKYLNNIFIQTKKKLNKYFSFRRVGFFAIFVLLVVLTFFPQSVPAQNVNEKRGVFWKFQSIDTMKFSRDVAREKLNSFSYDAVINKQVSDIAKTGVTHIAIATPYDSEFIPFLKRWVRAARANNLHVWFRGNWSGWEKWFSYPSIDRAVHIAKTKEFILTHSDLFEDGDVFSACPECENGGPGDPRQTGDVLGHRNFLIDEHKVAQDAFSKIGKNVNTSYNSMNGDVARLVMDKPTTAALGGIVVVDHYVGTPEKLVVDIRDFSARSGGKVVLGEFGVPIPDINGNMTEGEQAAWLELAFENFLQTPELVGLSYWTNVGGSTQLWRNDKPRQAVGVLSRYFNPKLASGRALNELGDPVSNAKITYGVYKTVSDRKGVFFVPDLDLGKSVRIEASSYKTYTLDRKLSYRIIVLVKEKETMLFKVQKILRNLLPLKSSGL